MDPKTLVVGVVVAAAVAGVSSRVVDTVESLVVISGNLPPLANLEVKLGPSMLGKAPDGGPLYLAEFRQADGGSAWLRTATAGCVRAPAGGSSLLCRRGPNTLSNEFYGELNRFPESEAQPAVNNCEPCPCAVWEGEDANQSQATLLTSTLGLVIP